MIGQARFENTPFMPSPYLDLLRSLPCNLRQSISHTAFDPYSSACPACSGIWSHRHISGSSLGRSSFLDRLRCTSVSQDRTRWDDCLCACILVCELGGHQSLSSACH